MKRLAAFIATTLVSGSALAQSDEMQSGRVVAVQARPFRMVHEFTASLGVVPTDSFYTGLSVGGAYTLHFNDLFAWEAIGFHFSGNFDTNLESELADRFSVSPEGDPRIEYLAGSHIIFTPLFGKLTFFNNSIIHASTYLSVGGGIAKFDDGFRPQGSIGPGLRVFFGQVVSTRLDIRNVIAADAPDGVDYLLHITLSVSFNFGDRPREQTDETRDQRTGFEALNELYPLSDPDRNPGSEESKQ